MKVRMPFNYILPERDDMVSLVFQTEPRDVASEYGVTVISLPALLKVMIKNKIRTREEIKEILDTMKKSDNYSLHSEVERDIFR